jgi:uncharacterized protein (DUF952 family)
MIYHVVTKQSWEIAQQQGFYAADSLALEGFIHCSTTNQVKGVLDRYYKDVPNLLLLHIDEAKLTAPLKYELAPSVNEEFPHIFGQLNVDAVAEVEKLN